MNLTQLQTEVLNTNRTPAKELAESLYSESICKGRKHIPLAKRQASLKQLYILLDDIDGVMQSE